MYKMNHWRTLVLLGSLAACTADKGETDTDGATSSPMTTDGTGTTTTPIPTTTDDATTTPVPTTTDDATTTPIPTTTDDPTTDTGGIGAECMARVQDCPEGLKCTAYAKASGDTWNANKCVPEVNNGGVAGDPCEVMGEDIFTGFDDCAKGYICLNTDDQGKNGFCVEFCDPNDFCPNTSGGTGICIPANGGLLPICLATCDPLLQDCPGTQACYGDPEGPPFVCFGPDPQDGGQDGSSCAFTNDCLGGLYCADGSTLEGCTDASCCTPFCPLDEDSCAGAEVCAPFFPDPFPEYENVGICVLPG